MRTFYKRYNHVFSWLAGIGIPVAIAWTGWLAIDSVERSKLDSEYVRIALNILSSKQTSKSESGAAATWNEEEIAFRRWALRLINAKAPVKFGGEELVAILGAPQAVSKLSIDGHERALRYAGMSEFKKSSAINPDYTFLVPAGAGFEKPPLILKMLYPPESLDFGSSQLTVVILKLPEDSSKKIKRGDGSELQIGDVFSFDEIRRVSIPNDGKSQRGDVLVYEVHDPLGRTEIVTLGLFWNKSQPPN